MKYEILDRVNSPEALKALSEDEVRTYCSEARAFLIENVERSGGHLASNLGVVELTAAIHRVFDSPRDHIIFDVGHQAYVHKMITGRRARFNTLREPGGLSGFTRREESEHDAFGAGHSSTSISAALGFAEADAIIGSDAYTVCVTGDGAYTGGMIHEALNNCRPDLRLVIVLNENRMSISPNRGAFASYLARVRVSERYRNWKKRTTSVFSRIPLIGKPLLHFFTLVKNAFKHLLYSANYFEDLGLYYLGPVNGNDYHKVERALAEAKKTGKCVILHVQTTKGKGYEPAERSPDDFHSVSAGEGSTETFHSVFADTLISMAKADGSIAAITAAMGIGTGLDAFGKAFPDRYFDVGIAEEHALTFSAGLAADGIKPYVAIYSTFLQRGYDNILHDIALQNLPVRMMIDRAGLAVSDGATHHGIFDVAFLSQIPNMTILAPATFGSLRAMVRDSGCCPGPVAIRYANAAEDPRVPARFYPDGNYADYGIRTDFPEREIPDCLIVTYGTLISRVMDAQDKLAAEGIHAGIILLEKLKPYAPIMTALSRYTASARFVLFAEEGIRNGGAAMILSEELLLHGALAADGFAIAAVDDNFASPAVSCDLYDYVGLSAGEIARKAADGIRKKRSITEE